MTLRNTYCFLYILFFATVSAAMAATAETASVMAETAFGTAETASATAETAAATAEMFVSHFHVFRRPTATSRLGCRGSRGGRRVGHFSHRAPIRRSVG